MVLCVDFFTSPTQILPAKTDGLVTFALSGKVSSKTYEQILFSAVIQNMINIQMITNAATMPGVDIHLY